MIIMFYKLALCCTCLVLLSNVSIRRPS